MEGRPTISLNSTHCLRIYASSPPLTFVFVFYVQKEQYKKDIGSSFVVELCFLCLRTQARHHSLSCSFSTYRRNSIKKILDHLSLLNFVLFVYVREPAATHLKTPHPNTHHKTTHTTRNQQWHEQITKVIFPLVGAATTIVGTVTTMVGAATTIVGEATTVVGATTVGSLNDTHHHRPEHKLKRKQKERLLKHQLIQNRTMATSTMQQVKVARRTRKPRRRASAPKTMATHQTTTSRWRKLTTTR